MTISVHLYHTSNKFGTPNQLILNRDKKNTITENDYVYIEVIARETLGSNSFLWLSDFKFSLNFSEYSDAGYHYIIGLSSFFDNEDIAKFSHQFYLKNSSRTFYKIFLNYYGECKIEIEGITDGQEIYEVSKLDVESEKISEIDSLLDYLLEKNQHYWNTISLTKVEATDKQRDKENFIWTLKNIHNSVKIIIDEFLPNLDDPITRLIPEYNIKKLEETSVVSEESLHWILENCNVLEPSNIYEENSFLILNRPFKITELLVQNLVKNTDVSENQIIHGFVNEIYSFLYFSMSSIEKVLLTITDLQDFKSKIYRSYYQRLKASILSLQSSLDYIKHSLSLQIPVTREHLNLAESNGFFSKQHYYNVYLEISKWINRGEAIFSTDDLFSGAKDISKLYEIYCLLKIIDTLSNEIGYSFESSSDDGINSEDIYNAWDYKQNVSVR